MIKAIIKKMSVFLLFSSFGKYTLTMDKSCCAPTTRTVLSNFETMDNQQIYLLRNGMNTLPASFDALSRSIAEQFFRRSEDLRKIDIITVLSNHENLPAHLRKYGRRQCSLPLSIIKRIWKFYQGFAIIEHYHDELFRQYWVGEHYVNDYLIIQIEEPLGWVSSIMNCIANSALWIVRSPQRVSPTYSSHCFSRGSMSLTSQSEIDAFKASLVQSRQPRTYSYFFLHLKDRSCLVVINPTMILLVLFLTKADEKKALKRDILEEILLNSLDAHKVMSFSSVDQLVHHIFPAVHE